MDHFSKFGNFWEISGVFELAKFLQKYSRNKFGSKPPVFEAKIPNIPNLQNIQYLFYSELSKNYKKIT
jgi:hypothetical protein